MVRELLFLGGGVSTLKIGGIPGNTKTILGILRHIQVSLTRVGQIKCCHALVITAADGAAKNDGHKRHPRQLG